MSTSLAHKQTPMPHGLQFASQEAPLEAALVAWAQQRDITPGRPADLEVVTRTKKVRKGGALIAGERRAELLARFWGHELQAAELFALALVRFADAPLDFRRGLARILDDEIRHMRLYTDALGALGFAPTDFPHRDWFWQRIPHATTPLAFVSTMGIGFEGGNLDHMERFEAQFRKAGDERAAQLVRRVRDDERAHVRFAVVWYERFTGKAVSFDDWRSALPAPLSPWVMKGAPLAREARMDAGLSAVFLEHLAAWDASGT
jgi:uncharacterized ferritin-like protein (DUF455 family)